MKKKVMKESTAWQIGAPYSHDHTEAFWRLLPFILLVIVVFY